MKNNKLDELFESIVSGERYLDDSLPTFGGEHPGNTCGIWSWDEDRLMIGACVGELEIVTRKEYNEEIGIL